MLEGLVAWVLNNYLGKYVENLNTDQLSVALLSGKVELENLPLKKDALRHLGLPVEIKAGFIGKVQLQVPVRQIRSAPWLISIEKLYLVAAPINLDEWDGAAEAHYAHERKVALLDALEAQWRAEHEAAGAADAADATGYYATSYSSWLSYGTGLLANIVENLQLKVKDVHIRYEDCVTCPTAFACGLTVASLAAESCDSEWRRGFTLLPPDGCSFKLLELHQLAVYWDAMPVPQGILAACNVAELTERMGLGGEAAHRYVVSPASARARLRRERTEVPLRSRTRPRLAAYLTLDTVLLDLTSRQYNEAVGCALGLERLSKLREIRAQRPVVPVRGHARLWWLYALHCHRHHQPWTEPKPTWESCGEAARGSCQYVSICLGALCNPAGTLPPADQAFMDAFEWRTPLHLLKPLREVAMRRVPKTTPPSTPDKPSSGRSMLVQWFPQWWGWYGAADEEVPAPAPASTTASAPALEEEILDVIADSLDNNTLLKRDTVFGKFEFVLNKGSLILRMENEHETEKSSEGGDGGGQMELHFSAFAMCVEARPRAGSHALRLALGALSLRDRVTRRTLFPTVCAPQGVIREGLSAAGGGGGGGGSWRGATSPNAARSDEPLFQLTYEKKPFGLNCDYKLWVKSGSIEVVYCAELARWARQFLCAPWGARGTWRALHAYHSVRDSTKQRLITHWEDMMRDTPGERRSWQVELDISAPQILFAEDMSSREGGVLLLDFGRLRLANTPPRNPPPSSPPASPPAVVDDEETFMTPCSTPPGSLLSPCEPRDAPPPWGQPGPDPRALDARDLHDRLYDRYNIELSDLQILVGRARDNWQYAHTKATSSLHLLDRFSISLQAERRVVATADPQYPTATLRGSLPALSAHLSEHKLRTLRTVLYSDSLVQGARSPAGQDATDAACDDLSEHEDSDHSDHSQQQPATLFMLHFAIDQLSLEVQSVGRSIAEVQVMGVRCALCWRPRDASLALSVHSLLLVDALQTYGPDFELLVASHKHVGMDTSSGSIRGSEPTSPTSPTSPAPPAGPTPAPGAAHPHLLSRALADLHRETSGIDPGRASPVPSWISGARADTGHNPWGTTSTSSQWAGTQWGSAQWGSTQWGSATSWGGHVPTWGAAGLIDSEALIAVELCLVKGEGDSEDLRIANILFNNLDIIANQETIVELIGFTQRVLGPRVARPEQETRAAHEPGDRAPEPATHLVKAVRTEITFDFLRLGVLLLRAGLEGGQPVARKIATATLAGAKIQATLDGSNLSVGGSLGGVHVVSLSDAGGGGHARVLSVGHAPPPADDGGQALHLHPAADAAEKALHFTICRNLVASDDGDIPEGGGGGVCVEVGVSVHVARVWYTHQPALVLELRSCLAEFKQYLANLARSLRAAAAAAADMALGLTHTRDGLYMNPRLSQSMEGVSPRRRTVSVGVSVDDATDRHTDNILLSVNVELESPVVVVPRGARSTQALVAHLGRMSLSNRPGPPTNTVYNVRVRDISLASLDVADKLQQHRLTMQQIYDVASGKPVLHDTALQFNIQLADTDDSQCQCEVSGAVVGALQVCARREQYEQLLDTLQWISAGAAPPAPSAARAHSTMPSGSSPTALVEPGAAVPTLRLDPAVRAAVLAVPPPAAAAPAPTPTHRTAPLLIVKFELSTLSVELLADLGAGERSLVQLSFQEFQLYYKKTNQHETTLQVSLHSITMEDLTKAPDSKHRMLMVSHTPQMPPKAVFLSKSCPDLLAQPPRAAPLPSTPCTLPPGELQRARTCYYSLPGQLHVAAENKELKNKRQDSKCGPTPPCSPECGAPTPDGDAATETDEEDGDGEAAADDNLVWVWVHTRDPMHPRFQDTFDRVSKLTKVEFNSLSLVVNIDSWVAVLDFFGITGDDLPQAEPAGDRSCEESEDGSEQAAEEGGVTVTEMCIRSLSAVVVSARGEWCGARVARVRVSARGDARRHTRAVRARLGALALRDLTPHAPLWRDTLRTHSHHALTVQYERLSESDAAVAGHETSLRIEMGPLSYVHTKRFVHELQVFTRDFALLRRVIMQARLKVSVAGGGDCTLLSRMRVALSCEAPVIIVPVSGYSRGALAMQATRLRLSNRFLRAGDPACVSTLTDPDASFRELLDVRTVELESLTLHGARGGGGGGRGLRLGAPLLTAPAHLTLQIEHNTSATHNVPDMTIQGTLTTLECALDPAQYRLVRGVLAHNLGEALDEPPPQPASNNREVWTSSSIKLDLQDVTVRLEPEHGVSSLACINFIKSRLVLDTYSDMGQDIDLVSQEILVSDTRFANEPANRRGNVFSHIIQPMAEQRHSVQAEVHARKHHDTSSYTILINNMRLMAILEWWERAHHFLTQPPLPASELTLQSLHASSAASASSSTQGSGAAADPPHQVEFKLNVTDSQLVLVEDPSVWDTNAVILRSTTVITYRAADAEKPVSCSLNELEVFSCVLGLEEETALSIVEPAALHASIDGHRVLHVSTTTLDLRLSYHDMRMFASMLRSIPVQARAALSGNAVPSSEEDVPANIGHMRARTGGGGGAAPAPWVVAPRWMRAAPRPAVSPLPLAPPTSTVFPLKAVQVNAECITLCVIDDCLDSDVPLLEVSLNDLQLEQDLRKVEESFEDPMLVSTPAGGGGVSAPRGASGAGAGRLAGLLSIDYYNRTLSGWEPVVEPWRLCACWEYTLSKSLSLGRLQVAVSSAEVLHTNVTSALIELCQLVRANWAADYYAPQGGGAEQSPKGSPAGHRRRSPFVPYALRNHTGHRLWFTTLITTSDVLREESNNWSGPDDSWVSVRAGDTEPFSFGLRRGRERGRRRAPHHTLHQLALRLEPWAPPDPVCVDRVGVFFRHLTHAKSGAEAWLVFEVSLEGSARKLVTVRSALQLLNHLPHPIEVRVDHAPAAEVRTWSACATRQTRAACAALQRARALRASCALPPRCPRRDQLHPMFANCAQWTGSGVRCVTVAAGGRWAAPLAAHPGALWTRPLAGAGAVTGTSAPPPAPAPAAIDWRANSTLVHYECRAPPDHIYRFCCVIIRERFPLDRGTAVAAHTLTLVPALRLENLLPLELHYRCGAAAASSRAPHAGAAPPGDVTPFHQVNVEEGVELSVKLEGFGWSTPLIIGGLAGAGGQGGSFSARLKLRDSNGRRLYLNARVTMKKTDGVKVSVSAAYWLVNRTGLPLVFRAEGGAHEAAGQFAEHELARMVAPLLFAFADSDAAPTLQVRLGRSLPPPGAVPEWCSPFGLGPGVSVKKLEVRGAGAGAGGGSGGSGGEERVYAVGVSVRAGRGRYRHTNIATFTPRYQLHNNTRHHLQFAQKCTATTLKDPGACATHVSAVAGCYLPWHWARFEREQLLCVRLLQSAGAGGNEPRTAWSGGFRVDSARTLTLACREPAGTYQFVRVEVAAQGATLFVVLTDAESAPPPLALHNYSPVSIMFHQVGCLEECVVGAHGTARWALPEPTGAAALALRAPGGPRTTLSLSSLGDTHHLLYQNFIYVAFIHSRHSSREGSVGGGGGGSGHGPAGDDSILVLEVPLGTTRVVLAYKRYGDRSQLWRRGPNGQLIHEGSSVPQPTDVLLADDAPLSPHSMVLDIEDAAPRPGRASALVLRRADGRRASTQAWRVHAGRLACAHRNLCVQPDAASLMALAPGARLVLALQGPRATPPPEQAVACHSLRPGSGRLSVTLSADGPTRLITIRDQASPRLGWIDGQPEGADDDAESGCRAEWGVVVELAGLSVSLVARAELVHAHATGVRLELGQAPAPLYRAATLIVRDMQIDNQLLGTPSPVLLYCLPETSPTSVPTPALHATVELQRAPSRRYNAYFFKHLVVALKPLAIRLEERLILQVWSWAGAEAAESREQPDEAEWETRRMLDELCALHATRYYFARIQLIPSQIRLSMCTANKLEGGLLALRRRLGLTLIKFEDAAVELEPFVRVHVFDTAGLLARQLLAHFKDELKWQAAKILGSVDFLGNPLGFVADVSEGVSGLLLEGNVAALLQNVTHGISNSAAKVSESLGDGLERVVGDESHEETRRRIRSEAAGAHLAAGLRGLGLGILGGMTSLVKHSYEGATTEGLGGFLTGVGKGLVGTVTKPVIGVLDLAAETATALRETSRRARRGVPARARPARPVWGAGGLLPRYCQAHAQGAALLHALNNNDYSERFLAYRCVRDTPHDIRALLSDSYLRIFTCKHAAPHLVMETHLSNLVSCTVVSVEGAYFVELGVRGGAAGGAVVAGGVGGGAITGEGGVRRPRVQCDTRELAAWVARHAAYARQLYHEHVHTLHPHTDL